MYFPRFCFTAVENSERFRCKDHWQFYEILIDYTYMHYFAFLTSENQRLIMSLKSKEINSWIILELILKMLSTQWRHRLDMTVWRFFFILIMFWSKILIFSDGFFTWKYQAHACSSDLLTLTIQCVNSMIKKRYV